MPDDGEVITPEVALFGQRIANAVAGAIGSDLVGVYFVGSVALGGYVMGESDIDIAAVSSVALTDSRRQSVASAVVEASASCPARGVEFTLIAVKSRAHSPRVLTLRSMPTADHTCPPPSIWTQRRSPAFWYVLDRAIAHRSGVAISGLPARDVSLMYLAAHFCKLCMSR